jgi:hypothetical protein
MNVQLTEHPADWQDPGKADWSLLGNMLKYMGAPR